MDILTFISELLRILIWPTVVIAIVLMLRKHLINLLHELKFFRFKDFEFEFSKELQKANIKVDKANLPKFDNLKDLEDKYNYLNNIAYNSSRSAILETWILIESELREIARNKFGENLSKYPLTQIINPLKKEKILNKDVVSIIEELKTIRNKAVHEERFNIEFSQAKDFINMSLRLLAYLKDINKKN